MNKKFQLDVTQDIEYDKNQDTSDEDAQNSFDRFNWDISDDFPQEAYEEFKEDHSPDDFTQYEAPLLVDRIKPSTKRGK